METVERLSRSFLESHRTHARYERELIDEIVILSLSANERDAYAATQSLFASLIEPLADSFEPDSVSLYNRLFAQLLNASRATESEFDAQLTRFGIKTEEDLFKRAEKLRAMSLSAPNSRYRLNNVKRAIVLSRITLGADVAVTSVIIERIKKELPDAEIVIVGGRKLGELFGGDDRIKLVELEYQRSASLQRRLLSWLRLIKAIRELTEGLDESEWAIFDPDSRLTQLGLLPMTPAEPDNQYFFFPSREFRNEKTLSLGVLASEWSGALFNTEQPINPTLSLKKGDAEFGAKLVSTLRENGARHIATLNFGVGGNDAKRAGDAFERSLVSSLLASEVTVILDKGAGEEESGRMNRLLTGLSKDSQQTGMTSVVELSDQADALAVVRDQRPNVLTFSGRVGLLAGIIGASDSYLGYDSAGQHIAAALGVPGVDIMVGAPSLRFSQRWTPCGLRKANLIVARNSDPVPKVVSDVLNAWRSNTR